jgi:5-methylcytosine-specific restriction endonuclease McrA
MSMCSQGHLYQGKTCPHCTRSGASRPELNTHRWQKLRRYIRNRDGQRCWICHRTDHLQVHHIIRGAGDDPSNLITICSTCHAVEHRKPVPKQ